MRGLFCEIYGSVASSALLLPGDWRNKFQFANLSALLLPFVICLCPAKRFTLSHAVSACEDTLDFSQVVRPLHAASRKSLVRREAVQAGVVLPEQLQRNRQYTALCVFDDSSMRVLSAVPL